MMLPRERLRAAHAMRCVSYMFILMLGACTASETNTDAALRSAPESTNEVSEQVSAPLPAGERNSNREPCVVASVSDGDSLRCRDGRRIRLLLLDAPEMSQTPFGTASRDALRKRIRQGDTAWLEYDVQRLDQYDRTLAYAWSSAVGGVHHNLEHARSGWAVAVVFPPNVRHVDAMRRAVADARNARRGLWESGAFTCEPIAHKKGNC